jgi:hypothetical protein
MAENWTYAKRQLCCSDCERTFQEGEEVYSMLRIVEDELQRVDLCRSSFDDRNPSQDVVYWRTAHRERGGSLVAVRGATQRPPRRTFLRSSQGVPKTRIWPFLHQ